MLKAKEVMEDIEYLTLEDKRHIYRKLKKDLLQEINISVVMDKYRGIAKNIWDKDAQEHVNELRENDRI
ncbi:hypothetical protein H8E88_27240 [candidate division KSB1 bacterium]|nr:hypothetical protein [candidate division KSB1 bacterium]MBL7095580.1 hypothetical protein [candidate division KSB1 bacterium]